MPPASHGGSGPAGALSLTVGGSRRPSQPFFADSLEVDREQNPATLPSARRVSTPRSAHAGPGARWCPRCRRRSHHGSSGAGRPVEQLRQDRQRGPEAADLDPHPHRRGRDRGCQDGKDTGSGISFVQLTFASANGPSTSMYLHRISGTALDGTWTGSSMVQRCFSSPGSWLASVTLFDSAGNHEDVRRGRSDREGASLPAHRPGDRPCGAEGHGTFVGDPDGQHHAAVQRERERHQRHERHSAKEQLPDPRAGACRDVGLPDQRQRRHELRDRSGTEGDVQPDGQPGELHQLRNGAQPRTPACGDRPRGNPFRRSGCSCSPRADRPATPSRSLRRCGTLEVWTT